MMNPVTGAIIASIATMIIGPMVLYLLSYKYGPDKLPKFPVSEIDIYDYMIFMPIFNAIAIYYGIFDAGIWTIQFITSIAFSLIFTGLYAYLRKERSKVDDWARPKLGELSPAGWYLVVFIFLESAFLFYSIMLLYLMPALWIACALFGILLAGRVHYLYKYRDADR
jgi:hypothetical protein